MLDDSAFQKTLYQLYHSLIVDFFSEQVQQLFVVQRIEVFGQVQQDRPFEPSSPYPRLFRIASCALLPGRYP